MRMPAHHDAVITQALRIAPRRYRMPTLSREAAADAQGALAYAIEEARAGRDARTLFVASLAEVIRAALRPEGGDASFQALVLRRRHPSVDEHARLASQAAADRRSVRSAVDAIAHPGKLRAMAAGPGRERLAEMHRLAQAGAWKALAPRIGLLPALQPALQRLLRGEELLADADVQAYERLMQRHGPSAGSDAAAAKGRTSARLGEAAEDQTVQAFRAIAARLVAHTGGEACIVARGLRTPAGFPGAAEKTKDEWDVALLRPAEDVPELDLVLVAEVKASPAAATSDLSRLLRGLRRLAHADAGSSYDFPSADGAARIRGASLRALRPPGHALPPQVIYCCTAPADPAAPLLAPAARAALLADPASLAFADALLHGESPPHQQLDPVWDELRTAPRLRSALHQYDSARIARDAMLHPADLLQAVEAILRAR